MRQPKIRFIAITLVGVAVLLAGLTLLPARSSAGALSTAVIGMFPKQVGEFAYADLKAARKFSWFPQIREQLLPSRFRQFEQFLSSAGIDPNTQVEELAWAGITTSESGGEEIVGVALGSFDPSSIEARFKAQKLAVVDSHSYHMYAFGSGSGAGDIFFVFIDSNTAAFGHRGALEKLIDVRSGGSESLMNNSQLFPLISDANGSGTIWAVLDQKYAHLAMQQLVPQANQFPQAAAIVNRIHAMTISVDADSGVAAHFQAVCDSVDDANLLAAAMQAGLMYRRYQEAQSNPDLARVIDSVQVTPSGDRLKVDATVSEDQLGALIRTKVFAVPM
ncbi:MAG: hypothetical protein WB780_17940 [Candidatus Acidiferrales bacterium]